MAKRKVLVSGYYGFGNTGDEAILLALKEALKKEDVEITVISGNPRDTEKRHQVKAIYLFNYFAIIKALFTCDLFLSGGGSLLQDVTSTRSFYYYISIIVLARLFGKKTVLYAQGIGPISGILTRLVMKLVGNCVQYITVRDEGSKNELLNIGVQKPPLNVTADAVLSINEINYQLGKKILEEQGIGSQEKICLVSLREWDGWDKNKSLLAEILQEINKQTGLKIVFISMHYPLDVKTSEKIAKEMIENFIVLKNDFTVEEILAITACAEVVLAVRLHALIFAAIAQVPFIGISYDPKVDRFLNDFSEKAVCSFSEIDGRAILNKIKEILQEDKKQKEKIKTVTEHLYKKACFNNDLLKKFLQN